MAARLALRICPNCIDEFVLAARAVLAVANGVPVQAGWCTGHGIGFQVRQGGFLDEEEDGVIDEYGMLPWSWGVVILEQVGCCPEAGNGVPDGSGMMSWGRASELGGGGLLPCERIRTL
jgi:hypothetical protein